ncbi:Tropinesterase [Serratia grimesii]|uniref:alpha/beta fold hydrolase n=1 Tax=Serratia grimesii TaxID=82995 RepID=UPI00102C155C|nr:alpha/beta hydrolase [Serratia grimesii]CAI1581762.1 Tropinesterase [Serratia grimesii]
MSHFLYGANVQANGIRQHYLRYGGQGPVVILIPGITSPAITWGFVAERLAERYDTYVLDVRGRGLSASGPDLAYDAETCAADVNAFALALNLENYALLGHSMGARFALRAAALQPVGVRRLVLVDPPVSGPGRREYPGKWPWYVDSIRQSLLGMDAEQMRAYCPTWSEQQRQLRAEWLHTCYEPAIQRAYEDFHQVDSHRDYPALHMPTLLMVAGLGGVIQTEDEAEIRTLQPEITITHVENAGHMIPWDDFDGFFRALGDFLD